MRGLIVCLLALLLAVPAMAEPPEQKGGNHEKDSAAGQRSGPSERDRPIDLGFGNGQPYPPGPRPSTSCGDQC